MNSIIIFTAGKFKGKKINSVPLSYIHYLFLTWIKNSTGFVSDKLKQWKCYAIYYDYLPKYEMVLSELEIKNYLFKNEKRLRMSLMSMNISFIKRKIKEYSEWKSQSPLLVSSPAVQVATTPSKKKVTT
jgi:hypothetical protein